MAALTAAAASACTTGGTGRGAGVRAAPRRAPEGPDVALAARVLRDEQAMLDRVVATVRAHPRLAGAVAGARAAHRAHVALLGRAVPDDVPSPSAETNRGTPRVPDRPGPALAALARAEGRLGAAGRRSALSAESGAFARILASMAAAASQQAGHLTSWAQDRR